MITINDLQFDDYDVLVANDAVSEAEPDENRLNGITTEILRMLEADLATMPPEQLATVKMIVSSAIQLNALHDAMERFQAYIDFQDQ